MKKVITLLTIIAFVCASPGVAGVAFAQSLGEDYLVEIGIKYFNNGATSDALHEFKKALMVDPQNTVALEYVRKITQSQQVIEPLVRARYTPAPVAASYPSTPSSREIAINETLDQLSGAKKHEKIAQLPGQPQYQSVIPSLPTQAPQQEYGPSTKISDWLTISGEAQASFGIEDGEGIWKRANFDLNEKNWRVQSDDTFNRKENTFDPQIYDRLRINLDTPKGQDGFGFHTNITIDPWSFTGKSDPITFSGAGGDLTEVQLKYWSNTGYTLNESIHTLKNGDAFNVPEIKVKDGKTVATTITSTWGNIFTIPELKIHRDFQPIRELWVDYKQEDYFNMRVFPFASEAQAYTSTDPLQLSNHHIFWEDSPWLRRWTKGNFNATASPVSFTKGYWDNADSFMVKDSSGARLTALRGLTVDLKPSDKTSLSTTWATPKDVWQDYSQADNVIGATRLMQSLADNLHVGATYTMRLGLVNDERNVDSRNHVIGFDTTYEVIEGTKLSGEVAYSSSGNDLTSPDFKTRSRGNAYFGEAVVRYPAKSIMETPYGAIKPDNGEPYMSKLRFFAAHMDEGFDTALASYRQTRRDSFWSRHIHFRQPFEYFYHDIYNPGMKMDDITPFAIGDGIDTGRDAFGLRWEATWDKTFDNLFDIRNVHTVQGQYVETVTRDEATWRINERLTAKALGIYQDMPKTKAGTDPFIYDSRTGDYLTDWSAQPIADGKDPSLKTGSLGLEYAFTDWLSVNGIYEYTNDYTLAYDNFPRGILNSAQPSFVYDEYGNTYLKDRNFLYDQQYFPQPPYSFYNVFKLGARLLPVEKVELYFDYTRNEFEQAGQISDGMNHIGAEIAYLPTEKLGFYLRYTYSRWDDLDRIVQGITKPKGHHNIFASFRYLMSHDDEFVMEFGVSPNYPITESVTNDPFGGSLLTIDTQKIIRFFYRKKF